MLFVGERSLNRNISIYGMHDKDETHIVTGKCKGKHRMDLICWEEFERRLMVDFRVEK